MDLPTSPQHEAAATPPPDDPLQALRMATGEAHAFLDSRLPIGREDASLADYAGHLQLVDGWLAHLSVLLEGVADDRLRPWVDAIGEKRALIASDLAHASFGAATAPSPAALPLPRPAQEVSVPFAWGVAYVIEGSQLGGAVLYKRLSDRCSPHPLNYLRGRGEARAELWRRFTQDLRANVRGAAEVAQAELGARYAFDAMLARMPLSRKWA